MPPGIEFCNNWGCLTAHDNVSNAKSIMENAKTKSEKIDIKNDSYSILKGEINEIKIDYQSALSILTNAKTIDNNEKREIWMTT